MKFHRVLLFTSIQMDITPVGDDLHVLLTCGGENRLGCTAFSTPLPDTDPVECETSVITDVENPEDLFCPYIAENLCKKTGQRVLCTGGIFVEEPDAHQIDTKKEILPYPICSVVAVLKTLIRILSPLRSRIWDMVVFLFSVFWLQKE